MNITLHSSLLVGAALLFGGAGANLFADLLLHEPFEYERRQGHAGGAIAGEGIQGLDGGFGFAGPWRKENDGRLNAGIPSGSGDYGAGDTYGVSLGARVGPLSYTDAANNRLLTSGNQMRTAFGNASWDLRVLSSDVTAALTEPESAVWLSFLAQANGRAGSSRWAFVELSASGAKQIWIGNVNPVSSGNWGMMLPDRGQGVYSADAGDDYPMDVPTMFLVKLETDEWNTHTVSVWLNPEDLTDEGSLGEPVFEVVTDYTYFTDLGVAGRYSTDFDELRLGTTFDSVTPSEVVVPAEPPMLAISRSGENAVLSWPAEASGYDLYTSQDLVEWSPVAEGPVVSGDRNEVVQPFADDRRFYRLQQ